MRRKVQTLLVTFLSESTFIILAILYQPYVFNNQFSRSVGTNGGDQKQNENYTILFQIYLCQDLDLLIA